MRLNALKIGGFGPIFGLIVGATPKNITLMNSKCASFTREILVHGHQYNFFLHGHMYVQHHIRLLVGLRMGLGVENGSGYSILCMWPHKHVVHHSYLKIYSCKGYQTQTKRGSLFCERVGRLT